MIKAGIVNKRKSQKRKKKQCYGSTEYLQQQPEGTE